MIPYNPSSFNSNKTILEQILELKNWLKDHPQYEVYYCNDNASLYPFMNTFSLADVPDNTNMDVGDLVVCNNAVYCTVISIDRDNGVFTAGYGVSFKGDTGAAGQQGYSLRVSSENYVDDVTAYHRNSLEPSHGTRENDTILFANGYVGIVTSLGAGATYYVTNRTVSFVGPQGPEGPEGPQGVSITNVTIDGNSHLIVTLSDGSTIDAGSVSSGGTFDHYVIVTNTSGTLSDADYNKLLFEDSVFVKNDAGLYYFCEKYTENSTSIVFRYLVHTNDSYRTFTITKATKMYAQSYVSVSVYDSNIKSDSATNGQVLTADGNGGASWQTPSGSAPEIVTLLYTSGTLSADVLTKVLEKSTIITYNGFYYRYSYETASEVRYEILTRNNGISRISITIGTGAYTITNNKIYGSSLYSESATNGQVLTADGNGGASWQNAGGTTLNKYEYSGNSTSDVYNIIANAKGRVTGYIRLNINYNNIPFNIANSYVDAYNYLRISSVSNDNVGGSGLYSLYMTTTSGGSLNEKKAVCIASNGTITTYTTFTITDYKITYWNDTQLHT